MGRPQSIFVASTGQNVGKTTVSLGFFSALQKRFSSVGFMKPVGQQHVETETGQRVDKDVVLFKDQFKLSSSYETMSPVLFPSGFTRDFLDGKISSGGLRSSITESYHKIASENEMVLIEGTGHVGVGSITELSNAKVAALLKAPMIIVAPGGLGLSFDELALNKSLCDQEGAHIAGVVLNRVFPEKREMVIKYMTKALARWNIPIIGCIPFDPFLSHPSMQDFELLFKTTLFSGIKHRLRHFKQIRLTTSHEKMCDWISQGQLIILPADREETISEVVSQFWNMKLKTPSINLETGLVLTGAAPPSPALIEQLVQAEIPALYTPMNSYQATKMISSFTAKIRREDKPKVREAIEVVEPQLDLSKLFKNF